MPPAIWIGIAIAVPILVAAAITVPFLKFIVPIFEEMPLFGVQKTEKELDGELVEFTSPDGITLRGQIVLPESISGDGTGTPRGVVIFCPELGGNYHLAAKYAPAVLEAGFALFTFDVRNQGKSDSAEGFKSVHWLTRPELADAEAAWKALRNRPELRDLPVFTFGVSRGGGIALMLAARHREVQGVIADSTFTANTMMEHYARHWGRIHVNEWLATKTPAWHLRMTLWLSRIYSSLRTGRWYVIQERSFPAIARRNLPVLLISGKRDSYVKPVIAEQIQPQLGKNCELWIVKKAKHNMARSTETEEYDQRVTDFLLSKVPQQTPSHVS